MPVLESISEVTQKRVALMQPTFMPWLGYFGLIHDADAFVFLDDFQFVRRSFHQRNSLFLDKDKSGYISVSVEHTGQQEDSLNTVQTRIEKKWKRQFLGGLKHNYKNSDYLPYYYDFVESWIGADFSTLAGFNIHFIRFIMDELKIKTPIGLSSQYGVTGKRSEKIIKLLNKTDANVYLSARGSFDYMFEDNIFEGSNIQFLFHDFTPVAYPQAQSSDFVPYLSILDSLLQQGAERTFETIQKSAGKYLSVQEMKEKKANEQII